jgi:hypothetical protein
LLSAVSVLDVPLVEASVEPVPAVDDESDELSSLACGGGGGGGGGAKAAASLAAVELDAVAWVLLELALVAVLSELVEPSLALALLF